ncbi:hypothetical protein BDY24DRAFT_394854 [Mrakia frigida]|uniref:uncharacterized protein n=1 Tax=Mrakia frigida TaxID=29902 RepID=UPI003FCC1040
MASSHIRSVQWQRQNCPSRLARRFPPNDDMMAPPKVSLAVRNRVKFALALHIVENRGEQPIQDYISDLGLHLISLSDAKETVASMQEQLREMRAKLASLEREKESGSSIPLSLSPRLPLVLLSRIRDSIED